MAPSSEGACICARIILYTVSPCGCPQWYIQQIMIGASPVPTAIRCLLTAGANSSEFGHPFVCLRRHFPCQGNHPRPTLFVIIFNPCEAPTIFHFSFFIRPQGRCLPLRLHKKFHAPNEIRSGREFVV